jgi:hypothetical protein
VEFASCVVRPRSRLPCPDDIDVYLVLDDFGGRLGRAWHEIDEERTDGETIITDLMRDEFNSPLRVVAFNTSEGWSRDVSEDIAEEILQRFNAQAENHSAHLEAFLDRYAAGKPLAEWFHEIKYDGYRLTANQCAWSPWWRGLGLALSMDRRGRSEKP